MTNTELYAAWLEAHFLKGLPRPDVHGLFHEGQLLCGLPYLRAYWPPPKKKHKEERNNEQIEEVAPPWQPETWTKLGKGWTRFFRADQVLDWVAAVHPPAREEKQFVTHVRRLLLGDRAARLAGWLVPIDDWQAGRGNIFERRVESIRVTKRGESLAWTRRWQWLPDAMRHWIRKEHKGLDPVHTPESDRAGLTRYLCEGWSIDDDGKLRRSSTANAWGPSTARIPYRLHDAPRRLMLGASLQARAIPLETEEEPCDRVDLSGWEPPGRNLRVVFSVFGGWTHEDAMVISRSAAEKFVRGEFEVRLRIPAVISCVDVKRPGMVKSGEPLARAFIDLFALGWRRHGAEKFGAADGWLEVALPGAKTHGDAEILAVDREPLRTMRWREFLTFRLKARALVGVGDKLSTRHGIKGVVSKVLDDEKMPTVGEERAEVILSPVGIIRRGAMGQLREANHNADINEPPRSGTIFVMRQVQDAAPRLRVRGVEPSAVRGQRYGEMEFWALMAHGAPAIARELLSPARSTAGWMKGEAAFGPTDHRELATQALNRFLAVIGARIENGEFIGLKPQDDGRRVVRFDPVAHAIPASTRTDYEEAFDLLEDGSWFAAHGGLCALDFRERPITAMVFERVEVAFEAIYVTPPWLRPRGQSWRHPLTQAYLDLIFFLVNRRDTRGRRRSVGELIAACVKLALGDKLGVGAFLRREVLGRRLTRSARAVIVPRPDLRIDQIALPKVAADTLFEGLSRKNWGLVLVNRNPTLHRRGLLALRPVIDGSGAHTFGLPLGILKALGADFDGDQVSAVALETEEALREAERLLPGSMELRADPFRKDAPAFPLLKELSTPNAEQDLARNCTKPQEEWCGAHAALLKEALTGVGDGWDIEMTQKALKEKENDELWKGLLDEETWRERAEKEMQSIYEVRAKGQLGGILRRELYRRIFKDKASFWRSVQALQAVTERVVQSALSVKSGKGAVKEAKNFLKDPKVNGESLRKLEEAPDPELVCEALGEADDPGGFLAWLARPTVKVLSTFVFAAPDAPPKSLDEKDPRIAWFLA